MKNKHTSKGFAIIKASEWKRMPMKTKKALVEAFDCLIKEMKRRNEAIYLAKPQAEMEQPNES